MPRRAPRPPRAPPAPPAPARTPARGDAAVADEPLQPAALARGDRPGGGREDDRQELARDDPQRPPHGEHADEAAVLVERALDVLRRHARRPREHGQVDRGRVRRVQHHRRARRLGGAVRAVAGRQAVAPGEACAPLVDGDPAHARVLPAPVRSPHGARARPLRPRRARHRRLARPGPRRRADARPRRRRRRHRRHPGRVGQRRGGRALRRPRAGGARAGDGLLGGDRAGDPGPRPPRRRDPLRRDRPRAGRGHRRARGGGVRLGRHPRQQRRARSTTPRSSSSSRRSSGSATCR